VWVLFVPNTSKYPDLAKDLIRYLSSKKVQEDVMVGMGGFRIPVYQDLIKLPMWQDRALKPLADSAPYIYMVGYPGPVTSLALETFQQKVVAKMMVRVLTDKWTADKAIAEAVETIKKIQSQTQ
jgi:ABC-type glycerol-3-phosphate transport system substrate-binding protein